jgi:hypothetical protein
MLLSLGVRPDLSFWGRNLSEPMWAQGAENSFGVYEEGIRESWTQLDNEHLYDSDSSPDIVREMRGRLDGRDKWHALERKNA